MSHTNAISQKQVQYKVKLFFGASDNGDVTIVIMPTEVLAKKIFRSDREGG